jgi:calcineurin-like phosphoesterase family protein
MENRWFTSDEHYGHKSVIAFCNRPFSNTLEMREELIKRHNEIVNKGDLVFHLGDMFWYSTPTPEALGIVSRLKGQHFYILGNHEEALERSPELRSRFTWVKERVTLHRPNGYPNIVLDHYAGRVWNGSHKGSWQLYGHSHNQLSKSAAGQTAEESPLSMDVGVDTHNYYPYHIDEINKLFQIKKDQWKTITHRCPACDRTFTSGNTNLRVCVDCGSTMMVETSN